MKKILGIIMAAGLFSGIAIAAQQTLDDQDATKIGLPSLVTKVNANFTELYAQPTLSNVTVTGTATVGGKSTLNGELEVNNSDVDINMTLAANEIDIAQTNATGASGVALLKITDARTGSNANDTNEASIVISAAGTYGLAINNGAFYVDDAATVNGTLGVTDVATFTAESVHNAGIDTDYVTTDAGYGVDTKSAGALMLGAATATSVEIADADVLTDIQGTLSVDQYATFDAAVTAASAKVTTDLVVGNSLTVGTNATFSALTASKPVFTDGSKVLTSSGTLGADQGGTGVASPTDHAVLVGSGASAVTPITVGANGELLIGQTSGDPAFKPCSGAWTIDEGGTNVLIGNIPEARLTNAAVTLGDDIGGNIPQASLTNALATAGPVIFGNIPQASLTNAMPTMPALALNDGTAVTGVTALAMAASGLTGNIVEDRLTNAAGTLGDNIGGNIPKASITNALETAGDTIGGNIPIAALTNALSATLYSGTYTNTSTLSTNTVVVLNGVVVSVTSLP